MLRKRRRERLRIFNKFETLPFALIFDKIVALKMDSQYTSFGISNQRRYFLLLIDDKLKKPRKERRF